MVFGEVNALRIEINPRLVQTVCEEANQRHSTALWPGAQLDDPITWHLACVLMTDLHNGCAGGVLLRDGIGQLLARRMAITPQKLNTRLDGQTGILAPARLRAVMDYVQAHLHSEIRLADLAAVARLSPFHFTRTFKAVMGKSPYQYVVEQRLIAGCRLLESATLTVAEIAAAIGFETVAGFTASFRRRWGVTPGAYQRSTCV